EAPVETQSKRKEKVDVASGVPHVTKDDSTESESESWGNDEDDSNDENDSENKGNDEENKSDHDKTPFYSEKGSNSKQNSDGSESDSESNRQEDEEEVKYDDEEEDEFAHTPPNIDDKEAANLESKNDDKIEDIHPNDAKIVSLLDVHVLQERKRSGVYPLRRSLSIQERVIALEKDVVELKKDPLHTQVTALVDDHLDTRMGETREEFMNFLSESLTARIIKQVNQLPQNLPEKVSNFAPPVIEKMIEESLNQVNLAKASSQPQSTYEAAATLTEF
nr:hypothetical protein [Tanacetum cinerariifolium]